MFNGSSIFFPYRPLLNIYLCFAQDCVVIVLTAWLINTFHSLFADWGALQLGPPGTQAALSKENDGPNQKKTLHLRMKKEIWKANWAWLLLEIWWWRWQQCNSFFLSWVIGKKRGSWLLCGFFSSYRTNQIRTAIIGPEVRKQRAQWQNYESEPKTRTWKWSSNQFNMNWSDMKRSNSLPSWYEIKSDEAAKRHQNFANSHPNERK